MSAAAAPFHAEVASAPGGADAAWIASGDGRRLRAVAWGGGRLGTAVIFPGRTEYAEKYGRLASDMRSIGLSAAVVDWRGQGLSERRPLRPMVGHVDDFDEFQLDAAAFIDFVQTRALPRPWLLVSHSMGGAIALRRLQEQGGFDAAVFSAPMWRLHLRSFTRSIGAGAFGFARLIGQGHRLTPGALPLPAAAFGFEQNALTGDRESFDWMLAQITAHPELSLGGPSMQWTRAAFAEMARLLRRPLPDVPSLVLLGTAETVVGPALIRRRVAGAPQMRLVEFPGARHEIFMESPEVRAAVRDEVRRLHLDVLGRGSFGHVPEGRGENGAGGRQEEAAAEDSAAIAAGAPRRLSSGRRSQIWIHDAGSGENALLLETDAILLEAPNWTLQGDALIVNGNGLLWRVPIDSPELRAISIAGVPPLNNDHVLDPDGVHIYLSAYHDWQLYRAPLRGGAAVPVTGDGAPEGLRHFLHGVSPDGADLAFVGVRTEEHSGASAVVSAEIFTVRADGTGYRQLTSGGAPADGPEYSPDGRWLYFNTEAFTGHAQIARMRADGSEPARLTFSETVDWFPHLSPDGRMAVYLAYPPGTAGHPADLPVELMVVRGGEWRRAVRAAALSGGQGTINVNSWSPDSRRFAFVAYPLG